MNAPTKLGLYGAGLAAVFAASFVVAGIVAPDPVGPATTPSPAPTTQHDPAHRDQEEDS